MKSYFLFITFYYYKNSKYFGNKPTFHWFSIKHFTILTYKGFILFIFIHQKCYKSQKMTNGMTYSQSKSVPLYLRTVTTD